MQAEIKKLPSGLFGIYVNGNLVEEAYSIDDANRKLEVLLGGPTIKTNKTNKTDHTPLPPPPQKPRPE